MQVRGTDKPQLFITDAFLAQQEHLLAQARQARAEAIETGMRIAARWTAAQARKGLHALARMERRAISGLGHLAHIRH